MTSVRLIGVEAGGRGAQARRACGALLAAARPACCTARYSYVLQDDDGQVALTHSVSAGLDYATVGPEHAWLHDRHRAEYVSASDERSARSRAARLRAPRASFRRSNPRTRVAEAIARAPAAKGEIFIVNLSGRGDKDIDIYRENMPELDRRDADIASRSFAD